MVEGEKEDFEAVQCANGCLERLRLAELDKYDRSTAIHKVLQVYKSGNSHDRTANLHIDTLNFILYLKTLCSRRGIHRTVAESSLEYQSSCPGKF